MYFIISALFFIATLLSLWLFPYFVPILAIGFLLFNLAIAVSSIFKKHAQSENPRLKIAKDILILVITLLLIIFLGGLAGMFANHYISSRFEVVTGFVSAIAASFSIGYFVNKGIQKISINFK